MEIRRRIIVYAAAAGTCLKTELSMELGQTRSNCPRYFTKPSK